MKTVKYFFLVVSIAALLSSCGKDPIPQDIHFSVLGDSYSTFEGYVDPETNDVWYQLPPNNFIDVMSVEDMWWYKVAVETGWTLEKNNSYIQDMIIKMQNILKNKSATNAVAEHAEMIYQDLLQNLIPILAALDIMPRNTSEHPLWRTLGGLLDEYAKNPFVMEKLRRAIKLDSNVKRNVSNYMSRAENLLENLNATEPDGILATTFLNGLLGQSLTFFTQAYQLATADTDIK